MTYSDDNRQKNIKEQLECFEGMLHKFNEENSNVKNFIQSNSTNKDTFKEFYNIFNKKKVVLVGAGPTARMHRQIPDAVYIGVNNACLLKQIQLDYLFCQDFYMEKHLRESILNYRNGECVKFFGIIPDNRFQACKCTPEAQHVRRGYKSYYEIGNPYYIYELYKNDVAVDISSEPLMADGIIFCAMQFALFGHPESIYLVGCDCTNGYFYESNKTFDNTYMIELWKKIKEMTDELYPDIKIVSINPVGLKNMFEDMYTE